MINFWKLIADHEPGKLKIDELTDRQEKSTGIEVLKYY